MGPQQLLTQVAMGSQFQHFVLVDGDKKLDAVHHKLTRRVSLFVSKLVRARREGCFVVLVEDVLICHERARAALFICDLELVKGKRLEAAFVNLSSLSSAVQDG